MADMCPGGDWDCPAMHTYVDDAGVTRCRGCGKAT